ncbi:MAG: hypothetical protein KKB37_15240 [Alphaproteobacteria bacterium]|nr:hypothetical protein [Alphaproteobacteria bacterium]
MAGTERDAVAAGESGVDLGAVEIGVETANDIVAELPEFLLPLLQALHASPVGEIVRSSSTVYPALETVHVIGIGLLFGGIFMLDLRLLGVSRGLAIRDLSRHVLPWVWAGFALNLFSGLMLFASNAVELAANISFQLKMLLLMVAGLNAGVFQLVTSRDAAQWERSSPVPASARIAAAISIAVWLSIITLGRLIAYWA